MNGTTQVDSTTSLLAMINGATSIVTVNSSIMRRALKSLVNQDIKLCQWGNLLSQTWSTVEQNFQETDGEADNMTSKKFFYLCLSQSMQKLVKVASGKIKFKDRDQVLFLIKMLHDYMNSNSNVGNIHLI